MNVKNMAMNRLKEKGLSPPKSAAKNPTSSATQARVMVSPKAVRRKRILPLGPWYLVYMKAVSYEQVISSK